MIIIYFVKDYKKNLDEKGQTVTDELVTVCFKEFVKKITNTNVEIPHIIRERNKKPYFKLDENKYNIQFSVSHTGNIWCCAMSNVDVGIDIQRVQVEEKNLKNYRKLSEKFFHQEELLYLGIKNEVDKNIDIDKFFKLWTAKEAYGKYLGNGIFQGTLKEQLVDKQGYFVVENCFLQDITEEIQSILKDNQDSLEERIVGTVCMKKKEKILIEEKILPYNT